jgi:hypothetical protein
MAVLKCPKCGRLCRSGVVPFPRCARCHEHLLKCRYCAYYDARMLDCVSPYRPEDLRIRDPDLYLACPHHKTTLTPPEPRALRTRVWMPAFCVLLLAVLGITILARLRPAAPTRPELHARVVPVEEAILQEPVVMEVQVWNPGPGRVSDVIVAIDRSYQKHVNLTYVEPEPAVQRRGSKWERLWFPGLKQGEVLEVYLHVTPIKQGTWQFKAEVTSPDAPRREQVATTLEISP